MQGAMAASCLLLKRVPACSMLDYWGLDVAMCGLLRGFWCLGTDALLNSDTPTALPLACWADIC